MQLVTSIVRPHRADAVRQALEHAGASEIIVMEIRGQGYQPGRSLTFRGQPYQLTLLPHMLVECVVPDTLTSVVIRAVITAARTEEEGDGRVFVTPVSESYVIHSGDPEYSL